MVCFPLKSILATAPKQILRRLCFYTCLSVILFMGVCGIPACLAGGIPACLAGLQGVGGGGWCVSQHALQVSRPTPKGEVEGSGWGVSRPTHRGVVSQHALRQTPPLPHLMATAAGSTHTTGMHSCNDNVFVCIKE